MPFPIVFSQLRVYYCILLYLIANQLSFCSVVTAENDDGSCIGGCQAGSNLRITLAHRPWHWANINPALDSRLPASGIVRNEMKWNESGFRPPLCTYRLNWARRTSWGWWDDWDDTVLQTQDSKFEPWRSEAEHATSQSRRLPAILTFTRGWGRNNFCFFQTAETGNWTPDSGVKGSGANHYPRAPALWHC